MTDEEIEARARAVVKGFGTGDYWIDIESSVASVAAAIKEACAAERSRCAAIARRKTLALEQKNQWSAARAALDILNAIEQQQ